MSAVAASLFLMVFEYLYVVNPEYMASMHEIADTLQKIAHYKRQLIRYVFIGLSIGTWLFSGYSPFISDFLEKNPNYKIVAVVLTIVGLAGVIFADYFSVTQYLGLYPFSIILFLVHGYIVAAMFKEPRVLEDEWGFKKNMKKVENDYSLNWHSKDDGYINVLNGFRGIGIFGGAGSGKSYTMIKPMMRQYIEKGFTGIVYDFKAPELSDEVVNCFASLDSKMAPVDEFGKPQGAHVPLVNDHRRVYKIDFRNCFQSHRVNPIHPKYMEEISFANEYAMTMLTNMNKEWIKNRDFFAENAIIYLSGIFWWLKQEYPAYCDIPHAVMLATKNFKKVITMLRSNKEVEQVISTILTALDTNAEGQLAGAISSLQTQMAKLLTPEFQWVLSGNDFSLDLNHPDNPGILTIGNDPELQQVIGPIDSLIMTVAAKRMNKKGRLPSFIILDEAPTIFIPNASTIPATARSNKVSFVYCAQDISQMETMYGKEITREIIANLGNQFYGSVGDTETAKKASEMIGKRRRLQTSINDGDSKSSGSNSKSSGKNQSLQWEELIKPDEIMNLEVGRFVGKVVAAEDSEPVFNVRPDINPTPEIYTSSSFVNFKGEFVDKEKMRQIMQANALRIREETEFLIEAGCRLAISEGYGNHKEIYPEHFDHNGTQIRTVWGDEMNSSENKDTFTSFLDKKRKQPVS